KKLNGLQIHVVADEPHLPYQRPPLSKAFLTGDMEPERIYFRDAGYFDAAAVRVQTGRRALSIDRAAKQLELDDATALSYDVLVLATGARARQLKLPGIGFSGVHALRSLSDAIALRALLGSTPKRLVIIGGGYIGLELAAAARKLGSSATVLEAADRVLARVASPLIAQELTDLHRRSGVEIRTQVQVCAIEGDGAVTAVACADGMRIPADIVIVGVGVIANDDLASAAGLATDSGIVVDAACRTSDPAVFAAGDCACVYDERLGRHVRLESVPNAIEQANIIAAQLCGDAAPRPAAAWFWSDQYDARLQMVGLATGYDRAVVRRYAGDTLSLAEFYLCDGKLVAAAVINRPQDFMALRRALSAPAAPVDERALADATVPLAQATAAAVV
ncbi:MAG TPA: FAD-dependent oxidoreductase, partial [Ramlibacter sp.]|nr:FAD-dependent oxidoreductase [Ramlibacter sp.]